MRSPLRALLPLIGSLLLFTGCASGIGGGAAVTSETPLSQAVDVASLHENRTPHVGDNNRVSALVTATGPRAVGETTLQLHTDHPPYGLTMAFSSVEPGVTGDVARDLLTDRAVLLLATIDNVDEVNWTLPELPGEGGDGSLSRAEADALVGSPVAEVGSTADGLQELVELLDG